MLNSDLKTSILGQKIKSKIYILSNHNFLCQIFAAACWNSIEKLA